MEGKMPDRFFRNLALAIPLLLALAGTAPAEIVLSFNPVAQTVFLPNTVSVDLVVSGLGGGVSPGLGGFQFNILYDPTIVQATDVTFGLDLGDPGVFEALTSSDVTSPGSASLAETSLLVSSDLLALQPSSFVMATIDFQTVGPGTSLLSYDSVVLSDESGNILPFSAATGSITVLTPEPALGGAVGALLLAAIAVRFRATRAS
jgi:hypothetical protein